MVNQLEQKLKDFIASQVDLDPEFSKMIDEEYWDLIATPKDEVEDE